MIGVGEGGFSGITPCLRRISFLTHDQRCSLGINRGCHTIQYQRWGHLSVHGLAGPWLQDGDHLRDL